MGAWGGICSFDLERWRREVVPACARGEADPLVLRAIRALPTSSSRSGFLGLIRVVVARSLDDIWLVDAKANELLRLQP